MSGDVNWLPAADENRMVQRLDDHLVLNKTIYAKRVTVTKKQLEEIIVLEIETHLRNYPELEFHKVGKVIENSDRSQTYPIYFNKKV